MQSWRRWGTCLALLTWGLLAPVSSGVGQERLDNLLKAAEYLDRAGLPEKAAEIRRLADEEARVQGPELLNRKLAQLEQLRAEVARLQQFLDHSPQIKLSVKIYEFKRAELEQSGLALISLRQFLESPTAIALVDDSGKLSGFLEFLEKQGLLHTLGAQTLTARDGQAFPFSSSEPNAAGGEATGTAKRPQTAAAAAGNLRFEGTAKTLAGGKLRLAIQLQSSASAAETGPRAAPQSKPVASAGAQVEVQPGQTAIFGGLTQKPGDGKDRGLIILLTAESQPAKTTPAAGR